VPGLSIITVVKDDPEGLQRTLASIDDQGDLDAEVVIIDGSAIALENVTLTSLPWRLVRQSPRGIYPAMNAGLENAGAEYVYYLNAGDTFSERDTLKNILSGLHDAPGLAWAFGAVEFFDTSGNSLAEPSWSYEFERRRLFARGLFPAHQGVVARTDVLRELGGFDESYTVAADYKLILQLSICAAPIRWDWPIARFQQGGTSTQRWWTAIREFHRARSEVFRVSGQRRFAESLDTARHSARSFAARAIGSIRR